MIINNGNSPNLATLSIRPLLQQDRQIVDRLFYIIYMHTIIHFNSYTRILVINIMELCKCSIK